jgi:hypothetical protein
VCVCEDNLVISFCLIWKFSLTKDIKCNFLINEDKVKKNDWTIRGSMKLFQDKIPKLKRKKLK